MIDIIVQDKVDRAIASQIEAIGRASAIADAKVAALKKTLSTLDGNNLRALSRAQLDQSRYNVNQAKADYYNTKAAVEKEKQIAERIKASGAATKNAQEQARQVSMTAAQRAADAEKIAQAQIKTANAQVEAKTKQAEAAAKQADASRRAAYSNELQRYAAPMAANTAAVSQGRADVAAAQTAAANAKAQAAATGAQVAQARLNTETAKAGNIAARTAVQQQNLSTAVQRTAAAQTAAEAATARAAAAQVRSQNAIVRSQTSLGAFLNNLGSINRSTTRAVTGLNDTSNAMNRLETSASFLRSDGLRWAKVLWALGGATLTAGAIVSAADAYTRLQNRLTVIADSQAHVNALTEETIRIANSSRQPIEATAKLYARLDLAMRDLGNGQATTGKLTEAISKALQLTGATAGEAASSMLQLSQAFNKGKLDGDEFRTMMEGAPILADALAKSLGVTRGQLLKMAPEGKLTAQVMTKAWTEALPRIQEAFNKTQTTIEQGFTIFRNNMISYLGALDKSLGLTNALSKAIAAMGNNLDTLTFAFLTITPIAAAFIGTKALGAMSTFAAYSVRTAAAVGAIRSPVTVAAIGIANLGRSAVGAGASMVSAFTASNTRAVALQLTVVRLAATMAGLANVARATGAAMLAAFSFGNVLLLLGVLTAAALAFGDQLTLNEKTGANMRDGVIAAFQEIGGFAKDVFNSLYEAAVEAFGGTADSSESTGQRIVNVLNAVGIGVAVTIDAIITLTSNLWNAVKSAIYLVSDAIYNTYTLLANAITGMVNTGIEGLNKLGNAANSVLTFTGLSKLTGTFGELQKQSYGTFSSNFLDSLGNFKKSTAAAEAYYDFTQRIGEKMEQNAAKRKVAEKLRADDAKKQAAAAKAAADAAKKKEKKKGKTDEEKRADMIQKVIDNETRATEVARRYGDARERLAVVEKLADDIKRKGFPELNAQEKAHISNLVQTRLEAERVGKALQSMYESVTSPKQEFEAASKAVEQLRKDGVLSSAQYEMFKYTIKETYNEATDAAYSYEKALNETKRTFGLFGVEAEVAKAKYAALEDAAKTGKLYDPAKIEAYVRANYELQQQESALRDIYEATAGSLEKIRYNQEALNAARAKGTISDQYYSTQTFGNMAKTGSINEQMNGVNDPFEPMRRGAYQLAAEMPMLGQGMADAIQNTLGNAIDNVADTMSSMIMNFDAYAESVSEALGKPVSTLDVLRYAIGDIVKSIAVDMIKALVKLGAQWAVQAALQNTIQQTTAATATATQAAVTASSAAMAATLSAAWSGAAVSASIATMGGAATTGLTAFMGAQAAGKAFSAIPAFADGGYISGAGTGRSDSLLARLSNGEMVMNAKAVAANRPLFEAANRGAVIGGSTNQTQININYYGGEKPTTATTNGDAQFARELRDFIDSRIDSKDAVRRQQGHEGYMNG